MKILCVCDQGNNRSATFSSQLKYWNNDCLSVGLKTNSNETLKMLYDWADIIILTENIQREQISLEPDNGKKVLLLDVGPDTYKRPYNPELLKIVQKYLQDNKEVLKN